MDITYTWSISGADGVQENDLGQANVVSVLHWQCSGVIANTPISGRQSGYVILDTPVMGDQFTAYESLTESDMLKWVFQKIDANTIQARIEEDLDDANTLNTLNTTITCLYPHWKTLNVSPDIITTST